MTKAQAPPQPYINNFFTLFQQVKAKNREGDPTPIMIDIGSVFGFWGRSESETAIKMALRDTLRSVCVYGSVTEVFEKFRSTDRLFVPFVYELILSHDVGRNFVHWLSGTIAAHGIDAAMDEEIQRRITPEVNDNLYDALTRIDQTVSEASVTGGQNEAITSSWVMDMFFPAFTEHANGMTCRLDALSIQSAEEWHVNRVEVELVKRGSPYRVAVRDSVEHVAECAAKARCMALVLFLRTYLTAPRAKSFNDSLADVVCGPPMRECVSTLIDEKVLSRIPDLINAQIAKMAKAGEDEPKKRETGKSKEDKKKSK